MVVAPIGDRCVAMQFVGSGELWPRLLALMERPDLGHDPRFDTADTRRANWRALRGIVVAWLQTFPSVEAALTALAKARIPCAPVARPAELVAEPHLAERAFFPAVPHPARGTVRVTSTPYHLDHAPMGPRGPAAYRVGEHTRAVLAGDLGYSAERIEALHRARIVDIP
jgi:crotonobetainyl-CoA:carnitine CoA-transferase CaiB-like acyl-CoA transferase